MVTLDVGSLVPLKTATCEGPCRVTNLFGDIVLNDSPPRTGTPTTDQPNNFEQLVDLIRDALGRDHDFGRGSGIEWLAKVFGIV